MVESALKRSFATKLSLELEIDVIEPTMVFDEQFKNS